MHSKKYIIPSLLLLSLFSIFTYTSASNTPPIHILKLQTPNSNLIKLSSIIHSGNITGVITAINTGSYTILVTNKDGTTTSQDVKFDSKTKLNIPKPRKVNNPHSLTKNKPNIIPLSIKTTATSTLSIGDSIRIKVKVNPDGTLGAVSVHLVPTKIKK